MTFVRGIINHTISLHMLHETLFIFARHITKSLPCQIAYLIYNDNNPYTIALAVGVERVCESGLLSGVDGQAVVVFDLNPSNDVSALEGVERGKPGSGVLVALSLVKVVGDGD